MNRKSLNLGIPFANIVSGLFILFLVACSSENELIEDLIKDNQSPDVEQGSPGELDFSRYIAIGNAETAGFADFALYTNGQDNSYPNLLAKQFSLVSGNLIFRQPDVNSENGYNQLYNENPDYRTYVNEFGSVPGRTYLSLVTSLAVAFDGDESVFQPITSGENASLNNFGVPGLSLKNMKLEGFGQENIYFRRFAKDPVTSSVLSDISEVEKSFFTSWVGIGDYLNYAVSGGQGNDPLAAYGTAAFRSDLTEVLTVLTANGTPGVQLDYPPAVTLPLFTAVTYDGIVFTEADSSDVDELNSIFSLVNTFIQLGVSVSGSEEDASDRLVFYQVGSNPILVNDETLFDLGDAFDQIFESAILLLQALGGEEVSDLEALRELLAPYEQSRPMRSDELFLYSGAPLLGLEFDGDDEVVDSSIGVIVPIGYSDTGESNGDQYYLTVEEQDAIIEARIAYNQVLNEVIAESFSSNVELVSVLPTLVDAYGFDVERAQELGLPTTTADGDYGIRIDGQTLEPDFAPNGFYSTDGVNFAPRGQGIITNLIIDAINNRWGATIPKVNVLQLESPKFIFDEEE